MSPEDRESSGISDNLIRLSVGIEASEDLIKDFDAVNNAVITPYGNGKVEGQINRLKNTKRTMYGKANFQLLRKIVLTNSVYFHQN